GEAERTRGCEVIRGDGGGGGDPEVPPIDPPNPPGDPDGPDGPDDLDPDPPVIEEPQPSDAYANRNWSPTTYDTCPKALHDSYSVVGPDGKLYPTWHPP